MSIPPLVCSTPPPPEQCEDDKDHEDFDLSYNLSQEDDEDSTEYTYGNYSTYSAYQTATEKPDELKWPPTLTEHTETIAKCSIKTEINSNVNITPISLEHLSAPKYEEAVLEDLNLIVDNNEDSVVQDQPSTLEKIKDEINNSDSSDTDSRIIDQGTRDAKQEDLSPPLVSSESIDDAYFNEEICDKETQNTESVCVKECVKDILSASLTNDNELSENIVEDDRFSFSNGLLSENVIKSEIDEKSDYEVNAIINTDDIDDDGFGDFEDFKITSTQCNEGLPITSENPWDSRNNESPSFTEFKASFDETKPDEDFGNTLATKVDDLEIDNTIGNDEFGDFDDFKSSGNNDENVEESQSIITPNVSVWNLNSPDNELQIVDSISGLLAPIFTEEITEPENDVVGKLETFLSETWGHLVDIDVRQPYMINWNNSLGQKTLLKALCIDSRNILFGPKWHYNMPKYAANLTTAPLQPQKQVAHSSTANLESNEKINKEANTWVDPFTQDGQEYTYAEALLLDLEHLMATLDQMAHKHSTLKISELLSHACNSENESVSEPAKRPTDLEVFSQPADISKIYSNTIKVQPVRHINLPDTHIFTPTDSETPRSKTIHYDTESNPVQIPVVENKIEAEKLPSESPEFVENEYWEFQDFKGTTDVPTNTVMPTEIKEPQTLPVNTQSNQGITYQTQILQPIKMEPIMPTLNWPDPGEVKETFDDFSDFISSTTWSVDKENKISALVNQKDDVEPKEPKEVMKLKSENIDDDFETFQSAPNAPVLTEFRLDTFTSPQISSLNVNPKNVVENYNIPPITMECKETKIDNNSIKIENKSAPFQQNSANDSAFKPISSISPGKQINADINDSAFKPISSINPGKPMNADILLPTNAGPSGINRSQQNSGQILQPLSLEGYSQINWPNPGIDLQDLSRFNPVDSVHTIKNDTASGNSKGSSPAHNTINITHKEISDDDIWGDFVSSAPKPQQATPKKIPTFADDDEWTDFVSSPSVKPLNGLSTISLNVHTNLNMQKSKSNKMAARNNQIQLDIPTLNYITPKSNNRGIYTEKHFQNL